MSAYNNFVGAEIQNVLKYTNNNKNSVQIFMTIGYNKSKDWKLKTGTSKKMLLTMWDHSNQWVKVSFRSFLRDLSFGNWHLIAWILWNVFYSFSCEAT